MFYRTLLCLLLSLSSLVFAATETKTQVQSHASNEPPRLEKSVVELERSVAILQVSSATVEDIQTLNEQLEGLQAKVEKSIQISQSNAFLRVLVLLLFIVVLACVYWLYRQHQIIAKLTIHNEKEKVL